jgi:hypothetical protein
MKLEVHLLVDRRNVTSFATFRFISFIRNKIK